jgi:predicted enzyme related to lactoylglutathione lyase
MKLGYAFEIAITVQDLERSLRFYKKLGYQPLSDPSAPVSDVLLTDGMIRLRLEPGSAWKVNLIYFAEDVREKAETLERLGVRIDQELNNGRQISKVSFTDPSGLEVHLLQLKRSNLVAPSNKPISKAGRFGELSIETEDFPRSLDFWMKLGFEPTEYMPAAPDTWASISDGPLGLGIYKKGHLQHIIKTPTIAYFDEDMSERIRKLKQEGMEFVQEFPGSDGQTAHAVAQAPEGQLIFLFGS